jgi:glycosyltransferase involved in cell wall biosynthesis
MRVLLVTSLLGGFAGDSGQMWHIANEFNKLGHQMDVFTSDGNVWFHDEEISKKYESIRKKIINTNGKPIKIHDIDTYAAHCTIHKLGMYSPNLKKIARKIIKNYDLIYAIHWYNYPVMEVSKIAIKEKIPFVLGAYGSLQHTARKINRSFEKKIIDMIYTKNLISNGAAFHSVGDLETEEYIKLGINQKKIFRIDHGIVLDDFKIKERHNIVRELGLDIQKNKYIIFVGRLDKKKGVDILLKAFSKNITNHKNLFLVIVGTGAKEYENELKSLVKHLKLEEFVKFTGFVEEQEKLELLETASLFVTASHSDVHPIAIQEALVMGVPVIISKASDWPEIDEYNAGITIDTNVNSVYDAIEKMLDKGTNLEEMSNNAKKLIEEKFLINKIIVKYEEMFKKIIEKNKL